MLRPCLVCGELSDDSRCPVHRARPAPQFPKARDRTSVHWNGGRWKRLSRRVRLIQPWCSMCGATSDLQADHIIPVVERPDLAYVIENLDVLCRFHNAAKGDTVSDERRAEVLARIAAARRRAGVGTRPRISPSA